MKCYANPTIELKETDNIMNIGRLQKVPLRTLWKHEEYDFSSWLALPENLELLSDEIGISLTMPHTETGVGKFSADIVAEEEGSERKVLIENQLEATNHDHLGKLFTYGAGLDAEILIWIVKKAREEHEQAINWVNERTDESLNVFLIQIEAWKIGGSDPAPKFNIIAKPNDWAKIIKQSSRERVVTDYKILQQKFWEGLNEADNRGVLGSRKPMPRHWHDVSIGSSLAHLALTINKTEGTIGCELYIPHDTDKNIFDSLYESKTEIETQLGPSLQWMRLEDRKATRIKTSLSADILSENMWPQYYVWLLETVPKFKKVFVQRLKN